MACRCVCVDVGANGMAKTWVSTCIHICVCVLMFMHVYEVCLSLPSPPSPSLSSNTHLTPSIPCLSVVWASDWGPWAQSPRKLHQSKQRGGTEPREYGDTKGLPCTVEDFRRGSHKAEQSRSRRRLLCLSLTTQHLYARCWNLQLTAVHKAWDLKLNPCLSSPRSGIALLTYANDNGGDVISEIAHIFCDFPCSA